VAAGAEGASPGLPEGTHRIEEGLGRTGPKAQRPWAVRIVDGTVRYRDERSSARHEIGGINLDLAVESGGSLVTISGAFVWLEEAWRLSGTVSHDLLEGRRGAASFKLAGVPVDIAYEGTLAARGGIAADGKVSVGSFAYKGVKIGPSALAVSVEGGVAKINLHKVELYGGRGQGTLTLDATGETAHTASLELDGVSLHPLLGDAAGIGWIDGRGTVALDLTAQGRAEQSILETLQGKVHVAVADGSVTGIDIDRSLHALQRGRLDRLAPRREDRTPFSELSGTFDIANGVARNQDLKLASANLQLSGEGTVELVPRRIDYALQAKITGGPPDDGAAFRIGTIELPVGVKGPLDKPEFTIKGQEGLTNVINQIGRNLRSREVQDAIKGLVGGNGEKRVKPTDLIERLLKKE
jgi:AsmA protein